MIQKIVGSVGYTCGLAPINNYFCKSIKRDEAAMIITKGNFLFRRLTIDDIELVRRWRNSSLVTQYMAYREEITPEMQLQWFQSVDNVNNMYFIIEYKGEKIGVINAKNIDWESRSMETGVFIGEKKYLNTEVPLLAVLIFGELGVANFNLTAYAHILKSNTRAIRYNKFMGFQLCEGQENEENQLYKMTKASHLKKARLIRAAFFRLLGNKEIVLQFEKHDYDSGFAQFLFDRLSEEKALQYEEHEGIKTLYFGFEKD